MLEDLSATQSKPTSAYVAMAAGTSPTTLWVESSSTSDPRLPGALPLTDIAEPARQSYINCEAWNKLIALPDTISSIGTRAWAHVGRSQ